MDLISEEETRARFFDISNIAEVYEKISGEKELTYDEEIIYKRSFEYLYSLRSVVKFVDEGSTWYTSKGLWLSDLLSRDKPVYKCVEENINSAARIAEKIRNGDEVSQEDLEHLVDFWGMINESIALIMEKQKTKH